MYPKKKIQTFAIDYHAISNLKLIVNTINY